MREKYQEFSKYYSDVRNYIRESKYVKLTPKYLIEPMDVTLWIKGCYTGPEIIKEVN